VTTEPSAEALEIARTISHTYPAIALALDAAYCRGINECTKIAHRIAAEHEEERRLASDPDERACNLWSRQTAEQIERECRALAPPQEGRE
jgi:hypothetical protein